VLPTMHQAPTLHIHKTLTYVMSHITKSCLPLHVLLQHTQSNRGTHANPCQLIAQSNWRVRACACVCGSACVCLARECRAHICAARLAHSNGLHAMCCMAVVEERQCGCRHGAAVVPGHGHGIYTLIYPRLSCTPICHVPHLSSPCLSSTPSPYPRLSLIYPVSRLEFLSLAVAQCVGDVWCS